MVHFRASLLACAGLIAITATGARASVDDYSVGANSAVQINLEVCSAETQLAVQGDAGTDLDFTVSDASGLTVHTDQGIDDYLSVVLEKSGNECATFDLSVANLGDEANTFQVVLEPLNEASIRVEKYIIAPSDVQKIDFKACGTSAELTARGDGDTDLDFVVRNSDGGVVHQDAASEDKTTATLAGLLSDCETFEMEVSNLGAVYNALLVMVTPKGAAGVPFTGTAPSTSLASGLTGASSVAEGQGAGEYRAAANASITVNLPVCGVSRLEVRGAGDTDLDFTVKDSLGETVHTDADLSDVTFTTLTPLLAECETFTVAVSNLGDVENLFSVSITDEDELGGKSGAGEYRVNASSSSKVMLRVCETTLVYARGDGDTDLDFDVTDGSGNSVFSDYDMTDQTQFTLDPPGACADYQMSVSNLGEVQNVLTVAFDEEPEITRAAGGKAAQTGENIGSGPGEYSAPASGSVSVDLPVCSASRLEVRGDGDTDLDFIITDASGRTVHSDFDLSDVLYSTLTPSSECETFAMEVSNLGDVFNVFSVALTDTGELGGVTGPGEYRIEANSATKVLLRICSATTVYARGDGDTDLDFDVTDGSGDTVHSDYDLTDQVQFGVDPGGECADYSMSVSNLGEVYNVLTITFDTPPNIPEADKTAAAADAVQAAALDAAADVAEAVRDPAPQSGAVTGTSIMAPPDTISTDGNNRNIAILNQTGETLNFIYWTNSATLGWGDDKLGESSVLATGQQWNVYAGDGSNACLFDFKAVTESGREFVSTQTNICEVSSVAFQ